MDTGLCAGLAAGLYGGRSLGAGVGAGLYAGLYAGLDAGRDAGLEAGRGVAAGLEVDHELERYSSPVGATSLALDLSRTALAASGAPPVYWRIPSLWPWSYPTHLITPWTGRL